MQVSQVKIEYGDFQTPPELTKNICQKLWQIHVNPDMIIEPNCGMGNFFKAASFTFKETEKILGFEINPNYINQINQDPQIFQDQRIQIEEKTFFDCD